MVYFYGRVSTREQNLDRQLEAAKAYRHVDEIFVDKQSGKDFDRPQYQAMKAKVRKGDEVVVKELDRLGRDKEGIKAEIQWYRAEGVTLRILDVPTTLIEFNGQDWIADMVNNILIEVLGAIAQNEREKTHRRQAEGIKAMPVVDGKKVSARSGRAYGRPRAQVQIDTVLARHRAGLVTVEQCCEELGVSRSTWYNLVRRVG